MSRPTAEVQNRSRDKNCDRVEFTVRKGGKKTIREVAAKYNVKLATLFKIALDEKLKRDGVELPDGTLYAMDDED